MGLGDKALRLGYSKLFSVRGVFKWDYRDEEIETLMTISFYPASSTVDETMDLVLVSTEHYNGFNQV